MLRKKFWRLCIGIRNRWRMNKFYCFTQNNMKKLTKLFLLTLCSWPLFLWFGNAQENWDDPYLYNWSDPYLNYDQQTYSWDVPCSQYQCGINLLWYLSKKILTWISVILWVIFIILTVKAIILNKRIDEFKKSSIFVYTPILNLYPIFKITIWQTRFFCLIPLIWFFIYSKYRNLRENRCCFDFPSRQDYTWIIVWIFTILVLFALLSELIRIKKNILTNDYLKSKTTKIS